MYLSIDLNTSHYSDEFEMHEGHSDSYCCRPDDWYELDGVEARLHEKYGYSFQELGFEPKRGDIIYVVVEDYSDGDTFGRTTHAFAERHVAKTWIDADDWIKTKGKPYDGYFGGHNDWRIVEARVRS
jgi:hypothetical protein